MFSCVHTFFVVLLVVLTCVVGNVLACVDYRLCLLSLPLTKSMVVKSSAELVSAGASFVTVHLFSTFGGRLAAPHGFVVGFSVVTAVAPS